MKHGKERQGELLTLGSAALWGLFPVITILSYSSVPTLISLTVSGFFATCFFACILSYKKNWHELKNVTALKNILPATLFLGVLYYLLTFIALQYTTPGNASIVALTEIFFSFLFFHVFKNEYISARNIVGALLMIVGALIVLAPNISAFKIGDGLILLAAAIAPFGNFYTQRARKHVSSQTILFVRSALSSLVFLCIALSLHTTFSFSTIQPSLGFLLINGVLLLGLSKILWVDSIHRISVTKANALGSIAPLFTLVFAWLLLKQTPTIWQLSAFLPIAAGILLLSKQKKPDVELAA